MISLARPFPWILGLLLLFGSLARAQDPTPSPTPRGPLQMTLATPFALTEKPLVIQARAGRWFPVAVTLTNSGEAVAGDVRLRFVGTDFEFAPNEYHAPVDLPSNSNKIVWLYGRMERSGIQAVEISFSGRGFNSQTQRVDIREPNAEQQLVVAISDSNDGLVDTLKSLRGEALFRPGTSGVQPNSQPVRAFQAARERVPDRWIGFDGADSVVLGDFPHTALAPPQIEALRGYVVGGGNLIVVGGGNAARLATSPLRDLWPQTPQTSASASNSEVAGLVARYVPSPKNGADRLGGAAVQIVRGPKSGAARLEDGTASAPLFTTRDAGAGRVLMLSYNPSQPPFAGWSGQGELWRDVFGESVPARRLDSVDGDFMVSSVAMTPGQMTGMPNFNGENGGPTTSTGTLLQGLSRAPQLRMPPVSQIAWFLALYVFFLVPVNYAVLRFIDRREFAWVTIPAIVAVFSLWAYSAALSIRGRAILTRQVDVVQTSIGSKGGRSDSLLWLFSPRSTSYNLTSGGQSAAVSDFANASGVRQGSFEVLQPPEGGSFQVESALVRIWSDRAFSAQSLVNLGGGVTVQGNTLKNDTPFDLQGAAWVQDQTVWSLGTLKRGASTTISGKGEQLASAELAGAIARASKLDKVFDSSTNSNSIPNQTLSAILGPNSGKNNEEGMLIAWNQTPVAPLEVEGARGSNVTLWVMRAPELTGALAPRRARVKRVSFEPFAGNSNPNPGGGNGYALYDCDLPLRSKLTLRARGGGKDVRQLNRVGRRVALASDIAETVRFEVWNAQGGGYRPLAGTMRRDKSPNGGWNFEAPIDASLARQPDRLLRLRVRLGNPSQPYQASVRVSSVIIASDL